MGSLLVGLRLGGTDEPRVSLMETGSKVFLSSSLILPMMLSTNPLYCTKWEAGTSSPLSAPVAQQTGKKEQKISRCSAGRRGERRKRLIFQEDLISQEQFYQRISSRGVSRELQFCLRCPDRNQEGKQNALFGERAITQKTFQSIY